MRKDVRNIIYPILAIGANTCAWGSWPLKIFSPLVFVIFFLISLILVAIINIISGEITYQQFDYWGKEEKDFAFNSFSRFITVKICGTLIIIWILLFAAGVLLGFA